MLEEDLTPYYNSVTHCSQFIRADRFDAHFRPTLFTKNRNPTSVSFELCHRSEGDTSFFFEQDSKEANFIGSCPRELWSAKCQKISINRIVNGIIYVCPSKLVFQGDTKFSVIMGSDIECAFWRWTFHRPDAIPIFPFDFKDSN